MLCSQAEYLVVYLALRPVYWLTTIHFISTLKYKMCMSLIRVSALILDIIMKDGAKSILLMVLLSTDLDIVIKNTNW